MVGASSNSASLGCPDHILDEFLACNGNDFGTAMDCADCVWDAITAEGDTGCDGIDAKIGDGVSNCPDKCNADCASANAAIQCMYCGGEKNWSLQTE